MHDSTKYPSPLRTVLSALFVLLALGGTQQARAQAYSTASKTADISAFVGYTRANPDYGPTNNGGFVIGANYTRHFGWWLEPSVEVRYERNSGDTVKDSTFLGGLRFQKDLRRFHPYVDALIGTNRITFVHPVFANYDHDNAIAFSYGGGVDVDIIRHFQVKADYQLESSNYGNNGGPKDFTLAPTKFTLGAVYRFQFKPFK